MDEDEEEGKNLNEGPLIQTQLERYRRKNTFSYHKINDSTAADKLIGQFKQLEKYDLNVVVFNFIDMLRMPVQNPKPYGNWPLTKRPTAASPKVGSATPP